MSQEIRIIKYADIREMSERIKHLVSEEDRIQLQLMLNELGALRNAIEVSNPCKVLRPKEGRLQTPEGRIKLAAIYDPNEADDSMLLDEMMDGNITSDKMYAVKLDSVAARFWLPKKAVKKEEPEA